jgi:hypothetical protein
MTYFKNLKKNKKQLMPLFTETDIARKKLKAIIL